MPGRLTCLAFVLAVAYQQANGPSIYALDPSSNFYNCKAQGTRTCMSLAGACKHSLTLGARPPVQPGSRKWHAYTGGLFVRRGFISFLETACSPCSVRFAAIGARSQSARTYLERHLDDFANSGAHRATLFCACAVLLRLQPACAACSAAH